MYSGDTGYPYLKQNLYLLGDGSDKNFKGFIPYNEFSLMRNDVVRELNTPMIGSDVSTYFPNINVTGYSGHTKISALQAPYHNWNLYLSYVYTGDTNFPMEYTLTGSTKQSCKAQDGRPLRLSN